MTLTFKSLSHVSRKFAEWRTDERKIVLTREYEAGTNRNEIMRLINEQPGPRVTSRDAVYGWAHDMGLRRPARMRRKPAPPPVPTALYTGFFHVPACFRPGARAED